MATILKPWIHFLHVLGAIVWVGGGLMLSLLAARVRKSGDANRIKDFAQTLSYVGLRVLMPAVLTVLLTGLWLVLTSSKWNFTQLWVLLGLGAFILTFVIGAVYLSRIAMRLDQPELDSKTAHDLLGRWMVGYQVILVILILAVWDMMFKPGL